MEAACRGARSSSRYQSGDTVAVLPEHDPVEANPLAYVGRASPKIRRELMAYVRHSPDA